MAISVIPGWINTSYSSGGSMYGGTYAREAGDLQIAAYKWNDADTTITASDTEAATWSALTKRTHTKSGSNLRA